jgi:hypothetical protein
MYQKTAQGLASLGRNQDSMLVHMTPGEVQGLQTLAMSQGGSLTINPQTGLPEAGFLSSMLPMLASAVGAYFGGPMGATAAGALVGGMTNKEHPMMGALMGGVSGYGIGGIGEGLQGLGSAEVARQSAQEALMQEAAANAALEGTALPSWYQGTLASTMAAPTAEQLATAAASGNNMFAGVKGLMPGEGAGQNWSNLIGQTAKDSATGKATGLGGGVSAAKQLGMAAVPLGMAAFQGMNKQNPLGGVKTAAPSFYNTTYNQPKFNPATGTYDPAYYGPGSYGPTANIAQGGIIGYADGGGVNPEAYAPTGSASKDAESMYFDANPTGQSPEDVAADRKSVSQLQRDLEQGTAPQMAAAKRRLQDIAAHQVTPASAYTTHAAHGGLMGLHSQTNDYAAGGKLLRGPGDGMSDSIPAVINGPKPQRAALADGEFVIPADVVSHLGNGSTEAGSKHLYSMMDKVRRARTGNPKQGKQINPARFMPA